MLLRTWDAIKPFAGPVLWLLGLAAAVVALASWFISTPVVTAVFNLIFILVVIVALLLVIFKERKRTNDFAQKFATKLSLLSERLHAAHHLIRDATYKLQEEPESAQSHALGTGKEILALLAGLLTDLAGQKVCVCIKIIEQFEGISAESPSDLQGKSVLTFCRDAGTPKKRWEHLHHSLIDNSDFRDIILGQKRYFTSVNLKQEKGYKNTTSDWETWYTTAIVVPIQLETARKQGGHPIFELLGFLCADAMAPDAFGDKIEDYANLLMSVGDGLYQYFDYVRNCANIVP